MSKVRILLVDDHGIVRKGLIVLAVVSGIITSAESGQPMAIGSTIRLIAVAVFFLGAALSIGTFLIPRILKQLARLRTGGVMLISALLFAFALSYLVAAVGLAPIVGAFAAGLILEHEKISRSGGKAFAKMLPYRVAFGNTWYLTIADTHVMDWKDILEIYRQSVFKLGHSKIPFPQRELHTRKPVRDGVMEPPRKQPEVASDTVPVDHFPRKNLHQSNAVRAQYKKGGVHDLSLGLVCLEELHRDTSIPNASRRPLWASITRISSAICSAGFCIYSSMSVLTGIRFTLLSSQDDPRKCYFGVPTTPMLAMVSPLVVEGIARTNNTTPAEGARASRILFPT